MAGGGIVKGLLCAVSMMGLTGCIATPFGGKPLQDRIEGDLAMFNAAYADAVNDQMLWNILRARDRLPTQYAGINAISAIQKRTLGGKLDLNAINLGTKFAQGVWGIGNGEASGSLEADPQYGVTPLGGENFTKAVLSPTPAEVFDHYWQNGWPKDLLLAVLVKDANKIADDPRTDLSDGCLRIAGMKTLSNKVDNTGDKADAPFLVWARTVKTYSSAAQTLVAPIQTCKPHGAGTRAAAPDRDDAKHAKPSSLVLMIEPSDKTNPSDVGLWELDLRSLDEVVFYLGEIVRDEAPAEDQLRGKAYGPDLVTAADCKNGAAADAPLFRVMRHGGGVSLGKAQSGDSDGANRTMVYAAQMRYGGYVYDAGPAAPLHPQCHGPGVVDRTANVLDLLTQVLQANLNPDSLRSSLRFIAD